MDAYEELNISKNATQDEIKKAYRDAAKKYHPDKKQNKDNAEKMQKINKAYQLIKTPERRERYDEFGDSAVVDNEAAFITSIACSIIQDLTKSKIPNIDKHLQQMQQRLAVEHQSRLNRLTGQKQDLDTFLARIIDRLENDIIGNFIQAQLHDIQMAEKKHHLEYDRQRKAIELLRSYTFKELNNPFAMGSFAFTTTGTV